MQLTIEPIEGKPAGSGGRRRERLRLYIGRADGGASLGRRPVGADGHVEHHRHMLFIHAGEHVNYTRWSEKVLIKFLEIR